MDLFDRCYRIKTDGWSGTPSVERVALPDSGGMLDQDERTMAALDVIESTTSKILREMVKRNKKKAKTDGGSRSHNKNPRKKSH